MSRSSTIWWRSDPHRHWQLQHKHQLHSHFSFHWRNFEHVKLTEFLWLLWLELVRINIDGWLFRFNLLTIHFIALSHSLSNAATRAHAYERSKCADNNAQNFSCTWDMRLQIRALSVIVNEANAITISYRIHIVFHSICHNSLWDLNTSMRNNLQCGEI